MSNEEDLNLLLDIDDLAEFKCTVSGSKTFNVFSFFSWLCVIQYNALSNKF